MQATLTSVNLPLVWWCEATYCQMYANGKNETKTFSLSKNLPMHVMPVCMAEHVHAKHAYKQTQTLASSFEVQPLTSRALHVSLIGTSARGNLPAAMSSFKSNEQECPLKSVLL